MPYIETLWCFLGVASGTVVEMFRRSFGRGYVLEREFSEEFRREIEDAEKLREENRRARLAVAERRTMLKQMERKASEDLHKLNLGSRGSTLEENQQTSEVHQNDTATSTMNLPGALPRHLSMSQTSEEHYHGNKIGHSVPGLPPPTLMSPSRRRKAASMQIMVNRQSFQHQRTNATFAGGYRRSMGKTDKGSSQPTSRATSQHSQPISRTTSPEASREAYSSQLPPVVPKPPVEEVNKTMPTQSAGNQSAAQPIDLTKEQEVDKKQFDSAAIINTLPAATERGSSPRGSKQAVAEKWKKKASEITATKVFIIGDRVVSEDGFIGTVAEEFTHRGEILYLVDGGGEKRKLFNAKELRMDGK